jgi:HSP20 family protein
MALSRFYNDPFFSTSIFRDIDDASMFPASDLDRWMMTPFSATPMFPSRPHLDRWLMTPFSYTPHLKQRKADKRLTSSSPLSRLADGVGGCKVEEDDTKYSFSLQAPGFKAEDMAVKVEEASNGGGRVLLLSGKTHNEKKDNEHNMFSSESTFVQRFSLGRNADTEKIEASLTDGILRVIVAKKEPEKKRPNVKVITITEGVSNKVDSSVKATDKVDSSVRVTNKDETSVQVTNKDETSVKTSKNEENWVKVTNKDEASVKTSDKDAGLAKTVKIDIGKTSDKDERSVKKIK